MKRWILTSIFCLALALGARAQEKPQFQLIPPEKLLEFPKVTPDAGKPVHSLDLGRQSQMPPSSIELTFTLIPRQGGVCSVPLLEAHADAVDPGISFKPGDGAVPIPQARVPAPPCPKK